MKPILFGLFIMSVTALILYIRAHRTAVKTPLFPLSLLPALPVATGASTTSDCDYTITYGDKNAPHTLVSFFDIGCTHCSTFFKEQFPIIKNAWVDNQQLKVVFKPRPLHQETLSFMSCCGELTNLQKIILFETLMNIDQPDAVCDTIALFQHACRVYTPSAMQQDLLPTTTHESPQSPALFFDNFPLYNNDVDNLVEFLQRI